MQVNEPNSFQSDMNTRNAKEKENNIKKPTNSFRRKLSTKIKNIDPKKVINKDIDSSNMIDSRNTVTKMHIKPITSTVTVNSEKPTPPLPINGFLGTFSGYFRNVRKEPSTINANRATAINPPLQENKDKSKDSNTSSHLTQQLNRIIPDFNRRYKTTLKSKIKNQKEEIKSKKDHETNEHIEEAIALNNKLKEELKKLKNSTKKAKTFLLNLLNSLRDLHKCSEKTTEKENRIIDEKTTLNLEHLIVDSPTGSPIEIENLSLKLKPLRFEEQDGQNLPVIGIEKLTCKVSYPIESDQKIEVNLDIKDLEIKIKAEWSEQLRGYVSSEHAFTTITTLVTGLINKASRLPSRLWVKGDHIGVEFKAPANFFVRKLENHKHNTLTLPFPCHIECNTLMVNGNVESLSLPVALSDTPFDGKITSTCTKLRISLEHPENAAYLKSDITAESLTATLTDTLTVDDNENAPASPKEITIKANGTIFHSDQNKVLVSQDIRISGHSDAVPRKDGKNKPLYRITNTQVTGTSFTQFFSKPPLSGEENTTYIVSTEAFSIENTSAGPAKINSLRILMDQNLNGSINADEASVDLDELLKLISNIKSIPWYANLILKGKRLICSLNNPITQGNIDIKHLKITKLRFEPNKNTSFVDQLVCKVLDWFVCPLLKRYVKFHTGLQKKQQDKSLNTLVVNSPFLGIKLGPFKIKIDLPISANVIDTHTESLNIITASHEKGIMLVHPTHVKEITAQLEKIKEGEPDDTLSALQALITLSNESQATNQPIIISLMTQQWPENSIRHLVENNQLSQEMIDTLLTIIRLFYTFKDSQPVALMLAKTIKQKVSPDTFKQLISDFKEKLTSDPRTQELYHELTEDRERST